MRVLLFALMLVLLPVPGWMGDAMAMPSDCNHALMQPASAVADTHPTNTVTQSAPGTAFAPCCGAADAAPAGYAGVPAAQDGSNAGPCSSDGGCGYAGCQLSQTAALAVTSAAMAYGTPTQLLRPAGAMLFASAIAAPRLKPPIA